MSDRLSSPSQWLLKTFPTKTKHGALVIDTVTAHVIWASSTASMIVVALEEQMSYHLADASMYACPSRGYGRVRCSAAHRGGKTGDGRRTRRLAGHDHRQCPEGVMPHRSREPHEGAFLYAYSMSFLKLIGVEVSF
jgi:hypothetical protein